MIHPTAVVHPNARLGPSVAVGPHAVIDQDVDLGPGCIVGPHVVLTGHLRAGEQNLFYAGAVIGEAPQDVKYRGQPTRLRIGNHNIFREHVTVHRSNKLEEDTVIGSFNFFMAHSHVGHNSAIGDHVIVANGGLIGGHVTVEDRVFISGNCLIHQFVRVGRLALMQGGSAISKDLPPFTIATGDNAICGLNTIGLRRAGINATDRLELRRLYHLLFLSAKNIKLAVAEAAPLFSSEPAQELLAFVEKSSRGVCTPRARRGASADPDGE